MICEQTLAFYALVMEYLLGCSHYAEMSLLLLLHQHVRTWWQYYILIGDEISTTSIVFGGGLSLSNDLFFAFQTN